MFQPIIPFLFYHPKNNVNSENHCHLKIGHNACFITSEIVIVALNSGVHKYLGIVAKRIGKNFVTRLFSHNGAMSPSFD